jgi:hypothetical protein
MRVATLLLLLAGCLAGQDGSIEGTAVNQAGGKPLAGVHVRLVSFGTEMFKGLYGAISDRTGHFSIRGIKPGSYLLWPEYPGFVYVPPKSDTPIPGLQIKAGQAIEAFRLEMTPRAVLAGRVIDEFGDPVANLQVQALPESADDEKINIFGGQNPRTDDRGEFRIVTTPGKFYLKAEPFSGSSEQQEIRTDGSSDAVYGATYYPSAASQDRATAVQAVAGSDATGLDIRLIRLRNLSISGVVSGMPDAMAMVQVDLRTGENPSQLYNSRTAMAGRDGKFAFSRLTPGYYRVSARYQAGDIQLQSNSVDLKLDSADESNVELSLASGAELTGTLQVAGLPAEKRSVRLQNTDRGLFGLTSPSGAVDADGNFRITNVAPGKYTVTVDPLPDTAYVKSVQVDGAAAPNGVVDLSRGGRGSRLKVLAASGAGQLSGKVVDKDGQSITNSLTFVFLTDDPKNMGDQAMIKVSSDGTFEKKGIRPGKYRLFALDLFHYVGVRPSQGGDDLSEPFARGEDIEIKEGDKIVKELKVLEKEEANGKKQ